MKGCFKCGVEKPRTEFYAHPQMGDGLLGKCKDCTRADSEARRVVKEKDPVWLAKEQDRHMLKTRRSRAEGRVPKPTPDENRERDINYKEKYPEKYKAHCAVGNAVRDGKLTPQACYCGKPAQAHHEDYSRPLDVIWLCPQHHADRHVEMRRKALLEQNDTKINEENPEE